LDETNRSNKGGDKEEATVIGEKGGNKEEENGDVEEEKKTRRTRRKEEMDTRISSSCSSGRSGGARRSTTSGTTSERRSRGSGANGRVKLAQTKSSSSTTNKNQTGSNFSKSIDSSDSFKSPNKSNIKLLTQKTNFAKSVDVDLFANLERDKKTLMPIDPSFSPQRSLDYPCIVRKTPRLSDIVRKRLLFQKVNRNAANLGDSFSNSIEREHVPKVPHT
jgi:hypothetical protein